jgi:predicted Fe-Mo cluster-binding NifX family protein
MKIALTVKGVGLGAWLDDDFANCGHVMVVDDDNKFIAWENATRNNDQDAGKKLADSILRENPDMLITGEITEPEKATLLSSDIVVLDNRSGFVLALIEEARQ